MRYEAMGCDHVHETPALAPVSDFLLFHGGPFCLHRVTLRDPDIAARSAAQTALSFDIFSLIDRDLRRQRADSVISRDSVVSAIMLPLRRYNSYTI